MRPERILAIVVALIIVVAVAAAVFSATRSAPQFDPATPEGTVQAYLQAVADGDEEAAAAYLAPDSDCDATDIARADFVQSARVVLRDTAVGGDEARVEVEVVYSSSGDPFDGSEFREDQVYELRRPEDRWLLIGEPWPLFFCEGGRG